MKQITETWGNNSHVFFLCNECFSNVTAECPSQDLNNEVIDVEAFYPSLYKDEENIMLPRSCEDCEGRN